MKKIRVAIAIASGDVGGSEEYVYSILRYSAREDIEFLLITSNEGHLTTRAKNLGVDVRIVNMDGPVNISAILKIRKILLEEKIHILHAHSPLASVYARTGAFLARVPVIFFSIHGWCYRDWLEKVKMGFFSRLKKRLWITAEKTMDTASTLLITDSIHDKKTGVERGWIPGWKSVTVETGIDMNKFPAKISPSERLQLKKSLNIDPGNKVIGTVARFSVQKGIVYLLEAFNDLNSDISLLLVGDGEEMDIYRSFVKQHNLEKRVIFTGIRHDLREILSIMECYVLPSLWEGLPVMVLTAMAMKVPVAASAVNGLNDVIKNRKTGVAVPPGDAGALRDAIRFVLDNPAEARRMTENAYRLVQYYTVQRLADQFTELYLRYGRRINK